MFGLDRFHGISINNFDQFLCCILSNIICPFSVGHCIICRSSIYSFWLPIWYRFEYESWPDEVYSIQHYMIKFVSEMGQVFLYPELSFPPRSSQINSLLKMILIVFNFYLHKLFSKKCGGRIIFKRELIWNEWFIFIFIDIYNN